jgi:pilus assembly protein CpaB
MNKRFVGVLTFAFLVAAGASLILYRVLINRPASAGAAPATTRIVLAAKNLEVGIVLKEEDVQLADWPGAVPQGASTRTQDLVGRGVTTAMYAKEPVIDGRLAPKGAGGGLAAMIPPGMRAVAVRVNEVIGASGFVVTGMHVDVLISGNTPGGSAQGTLTRTLLQNVEVLSAGQDYKKDAEGKPVVVQVINLLATPEQAEQLSLAASQTQIQLVLRNPLDRVAVNTPGITLQQIFGGRRAPTPNPQEEGQRPRRAAPRAAPPVVMAPPPPKKEAPFVMEIISGTKKTESKFIADNNNQEGK